MNKLHLLGANRSYDRDEQTVSVNQVVVLEGYSYDSYVVYEVSRSKWGITYHLINLRTYEFHTSDLIRPLSEKFGIGIYYDDANPRFLDPLETAALLTKATEKKTEDDKKAEEERQRNERTAKIGAERLRPLIPSDAKAVIIGELRVSECESYTDYYDYRIERTVILGFSTHTRNLFSEMRKHAANFEETVEQKTSEELRRELDELLKQKREMDFQLAKKRADHPSLDWWLEPAREETPRIGLDESLKQLASQFEAIAPEEDKPLLVPVYSPRTERPSGSDGIA